MQNSLTTRIFGGSLVAWLGVAVALVGQILLVPIFLSHWSAEQYGLWLALQAVFGYLSMLTMSYQSVVYGEFLKLGRADRAGARSLFWTGLAFGGVISFLELCIFVAFYQLTNFAFLFGANSEGIVVQLNDVGWILLSYTLCNCLLIPFNGTAARLLSAQGQYIRTAVWGIVHTVCILALPAWFVSQGAGFSGVGLSFVAGKYLAVLAANLDMVRVLRQMDLIRFVRPDWRLGAQIFLRSQLLTARDFLDSMRQKGVRLMMVGYLGGGAVTIFSTNRTVANVLHQAVATISNPLLPELMEAANKRAQEKLECMFAIIWLALICLMIPAFISIQLAIPSIFEWWTRGKVTFDPMLFACFSSIILLYAAVQPAFALLMGNNLLRAQLLLSFASAVVAFGGLFLLIPIIGLLGAALSLLLAECVAMVLCVQACRRWLQHVGLVWPARSFRIICLALVSAMLCLYLLASLSGVYALAVVCLCVICNIFFVYRYYISLPASGKSLIFKMIFRYVPYRTH